jgi:hypothetical protein
MITDPLPEDRPKIRLPPGWPEEAPPNFAIREGKAAILVYSERLHAWMRKRLPRARRHEKNE